MCYACETRPYNQGLVAHPPHRRGARGANQQWLFAELSRNRWAVGARLTAYELVADKMPGAAEPKPRRMGWISLRP